MSVRKYSTQYLSEHWDYLTEQGLYPGIDFLRAGAVLMVILFHMKLLLLGWVGVDLFFVISGFLIGGIILDKALDDRFLMFEFYKRRALRILPVYYFMILLCLIFKAQTPLDLTAVKTVVSQMLFVHMAGPYFFPEIFKLNNTYFVGGSWTLAIEEMFYLAAPLVLLTFLKVSKKNLKLVALLVLAVVLSGIPMRLYMTSSFAPNDPNWHWASFMQFHSRYDELSAGVFAAVLVRAIKIHRLRSEYWLIAATVLISCFIYYMYKNTNYLFKPYTITRNTIWLPTLLAGSGVTLLIGLFRWKFHSLSIVVLARLSYPLYLVHILFIELTNRVDQEGISFWMLQSFKYEGWAVIYIFMCVFLAYLMSLIVEWPFLRLYKQSNSKI